MEEVRWQDYKGKERQTERFLYDENQKEELPLLAKAGIGIAVTAGVLSAAHRTGAMRRISKFLDTKGKATMQAFQEAKDNQGLLLRGKERLTPSRGKELWSDFQDRRKKIQLELERVTKSSNILNSRDFRMAKELENRKRLIGRKINDGNYEGEIPYHIQEGYRFSAIMDDMRNKPLMKNQPDVMKELEKAVSKGELGVLDWGSKEGINLLLKSHGKGVDNKDVLNLLEEVRNNYKGKNFTPNKDEAYRMIEGMQEKIAQKTAELMPRATRANKKFKDVMIGHKQATVNDLLELESKGKLKINSDLKYQIKEVMDRNKSFGEAVFDENLYLSTKNGELFDYQSFKDIGRNTAEWWANTIPGGLLHLRDILNVKAAREQASVKIFQRGSVLSSLNGHLGIEASEALDEEVLFMYGKFVKLNDAEAINSNTALNVLNPKKDMYLTSSQFGTMGKMHRHMSGLMTDNESPRNLVGSIMDVGRQDKDSMMIQGYSVFSKFFNKNWERNRIKAAINKGLDKPEDYFELNTYFQLNTQGLTPRVLNRLSEDMPNHVQKFVRENRINFSKDEDMVDLFKYIGKHEQEKRSSRHADLQRLYRQFERNPDRVLNRQTPVGESNPLLGHHTRMRTGQDEINQHTSLYLLNEIMVKRAKATTSNPVTQEAESFRKKLKGLYGSGLINREDLNLSEELLNYSVFKSQGSDIHQNRDAALERVSDLFQNNRDFQESMRIMSRRTNPLWERHSTKRPENLVGDEFIALNETNIGGIFNQMFGIKSGLKERAQAAGDLLKQVSPFTGRRNMEDVTALTLFGNYYPVYRLQDALGNIGLGFSDQSMGNAFQMFNALMLKRIAPVYLGVEGAKYVDWKTDQLTGEGISERWENYKANARLEEAMGRTPEEIEHEQRKRMLRPGIEHWEAMPEVHIPGIGPVGMGDMLNNMFSIGPFLDKVTLREEDLMTYDETLNDLYYGTEEVRKSRWWFAGSKSAYRGDRVIEYAPNSFRLEHSDYEWTNTSATGEEYWGNHILPTFENPLGLLSFAIGTRDPYWYEKKHYYDRPYLLTGELFNPNTMVLGDIGNATIGKLIKPVKEMHPDYWGDPVVIYDEETSKLGERPTSPIRTTVSPAGRMAYDVLATPQDYGAEEESIRLSGEMATYKSTGRYVKREELDEDGNPTGAYVASDLETGKSIYVPSNVSKDMMIAEAFSRAEAPAPTGSEVKAVTSATQQPGYQLQISTQPRGMMDPEFSYRQEIMYRQMSNIKDPRDGSWRMQEAIENWSEPLGVYKWILGDEILGRDPYSGETVIQRADTAYNASNRFWESNLGSLGSQMSEIGRRFIRKDDGMLETYNPVKNTMPDWLPGDQYFINFQIGDPYSKVPNGEYRLPGEAYESLNELHPDQFGRYGAFDRFKILADVAPYSDEYSFWSQYLLDTLEEGSDLRKEATEIRRQVSQRRKKYDFTPYRFKGNDVIYEEVTVKKFLDDYTFLTEELGDQPVRLAGVEYRKNVNGILQNYIKEGEKVVIGIDEDPLKRVANDTYGTMRAVVFNELGNINRDLIERGRMVENKTDFSAPSVHARFTQQEIQKGARWESIAHASSPLNTKFLQVRTALEEYERDQIYGKNWATWDNFMLSDYIIPTIQGLGRFDNPLWSGAAGATTGLVLGRFFLKGGKPTKIAAVVGGLFGLGANRFFKNYEEEHGEAWIPKRRRVEQDINEYFDILTFLKYEGLYQKAREEIAHQTGYDVEDFAKIIEDQKGLTKERREELKEQKRNLFIEQPKGWEEEITEINRELKVIGEENRELYLPNEFMQALEYKKKRDTTLYAVDPYGDRMEVMKAFPYKDKYFFTSFVEANEEERERILELVPENQRRIYKALWGMGLEEQKPLDYYMQKYDIPHWDWEGWKPEYNLEDIKVKAVQEANLDLSDFNFWNDDVEASQYVPDLQEDGRNEIIQEEEIHNFSGFQKMRQNLISILQGQGLYDVKVSVVPSDGSETHVNIDYTEDRSQEIEDHLRKYGSSYI